jgi:hypothetical protein
MKKILLICASTLLLTACTDKQEYTDAVLAQMKTEKDLKDYNIDPEHMTECVVKLSSEGMPGAFPLDPIKLTSYQNYAKMLSMSTVEDKQSMLEELRSVFGSPAELASAHSNYTESVMNCIASIIMESEKSQEEEEATTTENNSVEKTSEDKSLPES